jgi:hypothetical protein
MHIAVPICFLRAGLFFLRAANKGRAVGTIRAILDHVEHSQACPLCRKQGVHAMARQLPLTDRILEQRSGFFNLHNANM